VTLDKIDLLDRKFSRSLFGYRRDAVDRLMAEAADTIGCLVEADRASVASAAGEDAPEAATNAPDTADLDALDPIAIRATGKR